jgi:hypothetical protein
MTQWNMVEIWRRFGEIYFLRSQNQVKQAASRVKTVFLLGFFFDPEDTDSTFLLHFDKLLRVYTASHPKI